MILRVLSVDGNGVAKLQDRAGQELKFQVSQLALCHLPDIDGTVDPLLRGED